MSEQKTQGPLDFNMLDETAEPAVEFRPRAPEETRKVSELGQGGWTGDPTPPPEPVLVKAPPEYAQLGLRTLREDVEKFKALAFDGNWSQPQLLRRMMRAYEAHPNKGELGR